MDTIPPPSPLTAAPTPGLSLTTSLLPLWRSGIFIGSKRVVSVAPLCQMYSQPEGWWNCLLIYYQLLTVGTIVVFPRHRRVGRGYNSGPLTIRQDRGVGGSDTGLGPGPEPRRFVCRRKSAGNLLGSAVKRPGFGRGVPSHTPGTPLRRLPPRGRSVAGFAVPAL